MIECDPESLRPRSHFIHSLTVIATGWGTTEMLAQGEYADLLAKYQEEILGLHYSAHPASETYLRSISRNYLAQHGLEQSEIGKLLDSGPAINNPTDSFFDTTPDDFFAGHLVLAISWDGGSEGARRLLTDLLPFHALAKALAAPVDLALHLTTSWSKAIAADTIGKEALPLVLNRILEQGFSNTWNRPSIYLVGHSYGGRMLLHLMNPVTSAYRPLDNYDDSERRKSEAYELAASCMLYLIGQSGYREFMEDEDYFNYLESATLILPAASVSDLPSVSRVGYSGLFHAYKYPRNDDMPITVLWSEHDKANGAMYPIMNTILNPSFLSATQGTLRSVFGIVLDDTEFGRSLGRGPRYDPLPFGEVVRQFGWQLYMDASAVTYSIYSYLGLVVDYSSLFIDSFVNLFRWSADPDVRHREAKRGWWRSDLPTDLLMTLSIVPFMGEAASTAAELWTHSEHQRSVSRRGLLNGGGEIESLGRGPVRIAFGDDAVEAPRQGTVVALDLDAYLHHSRPLRESLNSLRYNPDASQLSSGVLFVDASKYLNKSWLLSLFSDKAPTYNSFLVRNIIGYLDFVGTHTFYKDPKVFRAIWSMYWRHPTRFHRARIRIPYCRGLSRFLNKVFFAFCPPRVRPDPRIQDDYLPTFSARPVALRP